MDLDERKGQSLCMFAYECVNVMCVHVEYVCVCVCMSGCEQLRERERDLGKMRGRPLYSKWI